ncbi:hypothetical protein BGZ60DRAFT_568501 [Tricladium varicosporioides]|nr:hypothetical protein BGZ60DRAFT_568501 [Hymenoscyphus varicosporioides]
MAPIRSSNLERSKWRTKCREELSKHIQKKVGISIEPSQVRLIPSIDDPYTWKVLPGKTHLFSKNISDHSIGAYKELCEGIDYAFEAVPVAASTGTSTVEHVQETLIVTKPPQVSFSSRINELQEENSKLQRELVHWMDQAAAEYQLRLQSDEEMVRLKVANEALKYELDKSSMMVDYFRGEISKCSQIVGRIMPLMGELTTGLTSDKGSSK